MKKIVIGALACVGLLFLPACDLFKSSSTSSASTAKSGKAVIKLGGTNVFSADDFKQYFEMYKQAQAQQMPGVNFDELIAKLPEDQQRGFYNSIIEMQVNNAVVQKYVADQKWDQSQEYQNNVRRLHEEIDRNLANLELQKRIAAELTPADKDIETYYMEKRATHPYMKYEPFAVKPEGIQAVAVKAKDEAQAKTLVASAKRRSLKQAAAEIGAKADDLGIVTLQSTKPDRMVVMKIMAAQKFPTVDMVKSGDAWWVYESSAKKDAEFAPFAKVKDQVRELMMNELFNQRYQDQMKKLKEQYKVEVDPAFVDALIVTAAPAPVPGAQEPKAAA